MTINWSTFLLEILNFLVLLWILKHFLYRPVLDVIAKRRAAVEMTLADAAARDAAARELETRYQGRLDEWAKEKEAARAELARQLDAERTTRLAALKTMLDAERQSREAAARRAAQQEQLSMEHATAVNGARFASRLLGAVAGPETSARLVEQALQQLAALPAAQAAALRADQARAAGAPRVISAYPLEQAVRARIAAAIVNLTGGNATPEFSVDATLLAGLRIELGTWSVAANLADELAAFAELDHGH
jgi:F-type H+-transporting ATPase subunit b